MERLLYEDLRAYRQYEELPEKFPSNKSNFKALASKFTVKDGSLMRDGLRVLVDDELEAVWEEYHAGPMQTAHWCKNKT